MSIKTQQLAQQAIDAFAAWINAVQAEQDYRLYRTDWGEMYGEVLKKGDACKLLNRSRAYLEKLIESKLVKVSADGRVLTRSLQQFAETSPEHKRHMRRVKEKNRAQQLQ
jgi:hypothetical protein